MKNALLALRHCAFTLTVAWLALPALALESDKVLFVNDNASFVGTYAMSDRSISVVINGLSYRGYFGDKSNDAGNPGLEATNASGNWGRAFLFASSAKVIRCVLHTGFPKVSGSCQDADGGWFKLMPDLKP